LRVLDSGHGLPLEIRNRLFEPFASGKPEGIGLGLVVARTIAEAHGGTIRYAEGGPTCFEVILPRHVPSVLASVGPPTAQAAPRTNGAIEDRPERQPV
jgi:signal transduction histidine kinase